MIVVMARSWKEMDHLGVAVEIWWSTTTKIPAVLERGSTKETKRVVEVNKNKLFDKSN